MSGFWSLSCWLMTHNWRWHEPSGCWKCSWCGTIKKGVRLTAIEQAKRANPWWFTECDCTCHQADNHCDGCCQEASCEDCRFYAAQDG